MRHTDHYLYAAYANMKRRCYATSSTNYKNYGGRGIEVCERWRARGGFKNFLEDMGDKPLVDRSLYSLERVDNDGNYEPSNCIWATKDVQSLNKRGSSIYGKGITKRANGYGFRVRLYKKYYGSSTSLEGAIKIRDNALKEISNATISTTLDR